MKCTDARQALLIADPSELVGGHATEVSRHLRDCSGCAAAAAAIVEHTDALRRALVASAASRHPGVTVRHTAKRGRRRWIVAVPALAAAGLAAVLFMADTAYRGTEIVPATRAAQTPGPLVDQPMGTNVAVFGTDNPNIVVVWFF